MSIKIDNRYSIAGANTETVLVDDVTGATYAPTDIVDKSDIFERTAADIVSASLPYQLSSKSDYDAADDFCKRGGTTLRVGVYTWGADA